MRRKYADMETSKRSVDMNTSKLGSSKTTCENPMPNTEVRSAAMEKVPVSSASPETPCDPVECVTDSSRLMLSSGQRQIQQERVDFVDDCLEIPDSTYPDDDDDDLQPNHRGSTFGLDGEIGQGIPLILFANSKNPILIPPAIADLLRDKPPESELGYMDDEDEEGIFDDGILGSDLEDDSSEHNLLSGVEVIRQGHESSRKVIPVSLGNGKESDFEEEDDDFFDWDVFWLQFKTVGPKLVPFLKTLGLYFVIFIPEDKPSLTGMLFKVLPVLSLALFVLLHGVSLSHEHKFARRILFGLLFSSLGDAFLIWPSCFLHGMAAFAVAQIFYIRAFGFRPLNLKLGAAIFVISSSSLFLIAPGLLTDPVPVAVGVLLYSTLLTTMVWRALARLQMFEDLWKWTKICACLGGISFVVSDTVLALNRFYMEIPHHQALIMVTYYIAQLGIALSIVGFKEPSTAADESSSGESKTDSNSMQSTIGNEDRKTVVRSVI